MEEQHRNGSEMGAGLRPRQVGLGLLVVFVAVLAVVVGKKMSAEAMAVVIGVACGVAAGIPTSVLLWVVLTRREQRREEIGRRAGAYPPVVVIQGGSPLPPASLPQGMPNGGYWAGPMPAPPVERQFHVVGGDDLLIGEGTQGY